MQQADWAQQLPWWTWPLLMCLVLTGIHGYLGIHVLKRKVIFVDLAMAQIAALGAACAILLGYDPKHSENNLAIYFFSLGFTLAGAAVISIARMRKERVPQEAFIGIVYASASALAILLLSKTPTEGEQIKHMLVGSLLTVRWEKVAITAAIYTVIGAFHWVFRRQFFLISDDPEEAQRRGINIRLWDFFFYVSFGFVITSSVSIAGVLLVFSYLVVPGVIAVMFADTTRARIMAAWAVGIFVSILGTVFSSLGMLIPRLPNWDFPTGPSIVASFTIVLIVAGCVRYVMDRENRMKAVRNLAVGGAIVAAAVWGITLLKRGEEGHAHEGGDVFSRLIEALHSEDEAAVLDALDHIERTKDRHAVAPVMDLVKKTESDRVLDKGARVLAALEAKQAVPVLKEIAARDLDDPDLLVHIARAILDLHDPGGFPILIKVLEGDPPKIVGEDALHLVEERTGKKMDLETLKAWWTKRGPALKWREQTRRFE